MFSKHNGTPTVSRHCRMLRQTASTAARVNGSDARCPMFQPGTPVNAICSLNQGGPHTFDQLRNFSHMRGIKWCVSAKRQADAVRNEWEGGAELVEFIELFGEAPEIVFGDDLHTVEVRTVCQDFLA